METDKQEMQVMMRGRGECKGWTRLIQNKNLGRGVGGLMGVENMVLDEG